MKQYPKIDIYVNGFYRLSTTRVKTCQAAIEYFKSCFATKYETRINAYFAK